MSGPLIAHLQSRLARAPTAKLCVAFSGGPDSTALLHALSTLPQAHERGLRAIHVDHGLHEHSRQWSRRCQAFCDAHNVPLTSVCVTVRPERQGIEAAAREARYAVLASRLEPDECLITAHHRDDQTETVLLKLLRGAGPQGLGGMRERRELGPGWLWRPLLELPRSALLEYVRAHALDCIDDPANASPELARSFLRTRVMPLLREHWPHAPLAITHAAGLSRDAADYIDHSARDALAALQRPEDDSLDARHWLELHAALRAPVLDIWLHQRGLSAPTHAQRHELERQIRDAAEDRVPCVDWSDTQLHVWRGRLHAHRALTDPPRDWSTAWQGERLELAGGGVLHCERKPRADQCPRMQVHVGTTGIHLRPHGDRHTRALRDLFQQAAIPPWLRRHCPLIYGPDGELLAVADLWLTDAGATLFTSCDARPRWTRPV